jgi:hypothetical protein
MSGSHRGWTKQVQSPAPGTKKGSIKEAAAFSSIPNSVVVARVGQRQNQQRPLGSARPLKIISIIYINYCEFHTKIAQLETSVSSVSNEEQMIRHDTQ